MQVSFSRRLLRWTGIALFNVFLTVALLEGAVRVGDLLKKVRDFHAVARPDEAFVPQPKDAMYLADPKLGHRPNPLWNSHDARGWRNAKPLETADLVALGDSQTYGLNVPSDKAWPQVAGKLSGLTTYQMAFGGYGPAHYVPLVEEALALKPRVIVAAYYFGNHVLDSYWLVYNAKPTEFRRRERNDTLDSFASRDPKVLAALAHAEHIDPLHTRASYLDCQVRREVPHPNFQRIHGFLDTPPLDKVMAQQSIFRVKGFDLFHHSRFLQVVDETLKKRGRRGIARPSVGSHALAGDAGDMAYPRPICVPFHTGPVKTVFSPAYRLLTLTDEDPRVVEGARITLLAFKHVAERCRAAGVKFYVVFIPTKEMLFRRFAEKALASDVYMTELWAAEGRLRAEAETFFAKEGIALIDSLPQFEALIASGTSPYKQAHGVPVDDADGHPMEAGYEAIARAVAERLARDGVVPGQKTARR